MELKANGCLDVNLILVFMDQSTGHCSILCATGVTAENNDRTGGRAIGASFPVSFSGVFTESSNPNIPDNLDSSCVTASSLGRLAGDRLFQQEILPSAEIEVF